MTEAVLVLLLAILIGVVVKFTAQLIFKQPESTANQAGFVVFLVALALAFLLNSNVAIK